MEAIFGLLRIFDYGGNFSRKKKRHFYRFEITYILTLLIYVVPFYDDPFIWELSGNAFYLFSILIHLFLRLRECSKVNPFLNLKCQRT